MWIATAKTKRPPTAQCATTDLHTFRGIVLKKLTRRQFMALSGKAATGAVIFVACGLPERELIVQSPVGLPEDLVRGEDAWYATTWGDVPGGDGLIVRVMEGRAKKVAGNPDFPVIRANRASDTMRRSNCSTTRIGSPDPIGAAAREGY